MSARTERQPKNAALAMAVEILGGQTALGNAVGKSQPHVWSWLYRTGVVPSEHLAPIEDATRAAGRMITVRELATGELSDAARPAPETPAKQGEAA